MKITSYDTGIYKVPLTESWGSSNYSLSSLEFVIVWLETDDHRTGTGWTFSVGNGGSAFKNLIDHYLAPKVLGGDPLEVERLWNTMWRIPGLAAWLWQRREPAPRHRRTARPDGDIPFPGLPVGQDEDRS
ncbi:hypothetical protein [Saccharopolyspora pogona]|uniref:hypothetical protein n=1 Tax=Saccharopolyspora pogona TaxID=333966 RepID=UPI0016839F90